jgi:hypothetical protein
LDLNLAWGELPRFLIADFPSQGLMVDFRRPAPYSDPSTEYQGLTQSVASSQVIKLERDAGISHPQNSDRKPLSGRRNSSVSFRQQSEVDLRSFVAARRRDNEPGPG